MESFSERVESFFQKMRLYTGESSIKNKPYLHILRDHVPSILKFWYGMLGFGYGYFSCSAGEHLNKQIKTMERETNQDSARFRTVMRIRMINQFHFTESVIRNKVSITCSRCKQIGHNRKNKSCPMHPDQPQMLFDETDNEEEEEV